MEVSKVQLQNYYNNMLMVDKDIGNRRKGQHNHQYDYYNPHKQFNVMINGIVFQVVSSVSLLENSLEE